MTRRERDALITGRHAADDVTRPKPRMRHVVNDVNARLWLFKDVENYVRCVAPRPRLAPSRSQLFIPIFFCNSGLNARKFPPYFQVKRFRSFCGCPIVSRVTKVREKTCRNLLSCSIFPRSSKTLFTPPNKLLFAIWKQKYFSPQTAILLSLSSNLSRLSSVLASPVCSTLLSYEACIINFQKINTSNLKTYGVFLHTGYKFEPRFRWTSWNFRC